MIRKICKNIYTKTRIDKGIDKVNVKTWLCFIFLGIAYLIYRSFETENKVNNRYTFYHYHTDSIIRDTFKIVKIKYMTKIVNTKSIKSKKVNYSSAELKVMGHNISTVQKGILKTCKLERND